jgi:hypothetical protein
MPRHRGRVCRLALSPRVPAPSRSVARSLVRRAIRALWQWAQGRKKRWGSARKRPPHFRAAVSYFFFAFLAFLAAFFAFFAIGPPEGVQLVPDGGNGYRVIPAESLRASQAVV